MKREYDYGIYEGMEEKNSHMNYGVGRHTYIENGLAIIFDGSWLNNKFHGYGRRITINGDYWISQI